MSQENVDVVRRLVAEMNEGSESPWHAADPEIDWHLDSNHPDQRVLHGARNAMLYFRDWRDSFDGVLIDADQYIDRREYVVMPFVARGTLKDSNYEVLLAETWVFKVHNALVVEVREYLAQTRRSPT